MPNELKPCPFCGATPYFNRYVKFDEVDESYSDYVRVRCQCGAMSREIKYNAVIHREDGEYKEAAKYWNRRADNG